MPRAAEIVRARQVTALETHFTLKMKTASPCLSSPARCSKCRCRIRRNPIGFASSPTRTQTFDIVVRKVGRVSGAVTALEQGQSLFVRGPLATGSRWTSCADKIFSSSPAESASAHEKPDPLHPGQAFRVQEVQPFLRVKTPQEQLFIETWRSGARARTSSFTKPSTAPMINGRATSA